MENLDRQLGSADQTVLANEQAGDFYCYTGELVERKEMAQWFLKITEYADELLDEIGVA